MQHNFVSRIKPALGDTTPLFLAMSHKQSVKIIERSTGGDTSCVILLSSPYVMRQHSTLSYAARWGDASHVEMCVGRMVGELRLILENLWRRPTAIRGAIRRPHNSNHLQTEGPLLLSVRAEKSYFFCQNVLCVFFFFSKKKSYSNYSIFP